MSFDNLPIALTIAGSDPGGCAGIQADLKTFHTFRVYGTTVITAVTAQNTRGVKAVHPIPAQTVRDQIDAVVTDLRPAALKTGMLASADLVSAVAESLGQHSLKPYVMDPVMVATSGDRLLEEEAVNMLKNNLLPLADIVTPNLHEAALLTNLAVVSVDDMRAAAERILSYGAGAVLIKGGHLRGDPVDLLASPGGERIWRRPRIESRHIHGTGCTLAAAITAGLARGDGLEMAVDRAGLFVARAIAEAPGLGRGHGPINHFADVD